MGTVVDENNPQIDPELEVRKLQDLVKHLEQQNQLLRSNTNDSGGLRETNENVERNVISTGTRGGNKITDNIVKAKDINNSKHKNAFNDIEVLDLPMEGGREDEANWLYSSPKKDLCAKKDSKASPHEWMRQDLEEASPQVASVRRSLVFKLNEVARMARSPSSGALSSSSLLSPSPVSTPLSTKTYRLKSPQLENPLLTFSNSTASELYSNEDPCSSANNNNTTEITNVNEEYRPKIRKPLKGLGSRVNTNTFRKKKGSGPLIESPVIDDGSADSFLDMGDLHQQLDEYHQPIIRSSNQSDEVHSPRFTPERDNNGNGNRTLSRNSSLENSADSPRASDYKLTDVVDVQVLARMQEESLRQSMNSPKIARKTLTKPRPSHENGGYGSSRSSPGRYLESDNGYQSMGRSNASLGSLSSNGSDSPAGSPYGSQYLESTQTADGHRRSMPNLAKTMPLSLHTVPSDPVINSGGRPRNPIRKSTTPSSKYGSPVGRYQGSAGTPRRGSSPQQYQQYQSQTNRIESPQRSSLSRTTAANRTQQQPQYLSQTVDSTPPRSSGGGRGPQGQTQMRTSYSNSPQQRTLSPHGGNTNPGISDNRNKSPNRSGLPTPRSVTGIPRPGSSSKLPGPRKSAIPASRRAALFTRGEDSWKDGCY